MSPRRFQRPLLVALGIGAIAAGLAWLGSRPSAPPPPSPQRLSLAAAMRSGETTGFERAVAPRPFSFPRDHGPHPGFRTEWWYVTGHLRTARGGRQFGYQLTIFRSALAPSDTGEPGSSDWRADTLYMGHLALTDVARERFASFERFARGAAGLAGAHAHPFRVWIEDWSLEQGPGTGDDIFPLDLVAADGEIALDLGLRPLKPVVLQGEAGLSRKGARPGNASYYYSFTRLATTGTVRVGERQWSVEGTSWLDREWSTSALEPGVVGWDWFALQLDDGRELMLYYLRRRSGEADPHSAGVMVAADGSYARLAAHQFEVEELDRWRSPETGVVYPSGWRLSSQTAGVDLRVEPLVASQEHTDSVLYWEGAVAVEGTSGGARAGGSGYVELTGYGEE